MRQALLDLDYSDVYHFAAIFNENPHDASLWNAALLAKYENLGSPFQKSDWDALLGHCMAVTDTPCTVFWRELVDLYPDAKVILTLRDTPEQWHRSAIETMMHVFDGVYPRHPTLLQRVFKLFGPPPTEVDRMHELLLKHYMYKDLHTNGVQFYKEHAEEVQRVVPKERLLVMNVKEGWDPLCRFLGVEKPGWEFPRVNDTGSFRRNWGVIEGWMWKGVMVNMGKTLGWAVGAALVAWWLMTYARGLVGMGVAGLTVWWCIRDRL
ncbi:MAG: hypothetical protein M1828_004267 [Chrysothrix sp. TS-e1954]|nr:MAG: hypothetical protein M1828_004267 [Chrysothrix sp. TS-e1954]